MSELKQSWRNESSEMQKVRAEFERQHKGRDLRRHNMRGTYQSATIAALWNQHLRTIEWIRRTQPEATKPAQDLSAAILALPVPEIGGNFQQGFRTALIKAAAKDAERYRWYRSCGDERDQLAILDARGNIIPEALDAEIDARIAAIQAQKDGHG